MHWIKNLKLMPKLMLTFGVILLVMLLQGIVAYRGLHSLNNVTTELAGSKPEDYELAGKGNAYVRIDAEAKVTGRAVYTDDVDLPGHVGDRRIAGLAVHHGSLRVHRDDRLTDALQVPGDPVRGALAVLGQADDGPAAVAREQPTDDLRVVRRVADDGGLGEALVAVVDLDDVEAVRAQ